MISNRLKELAKAAVEARGAALLAQFEYAPTPEAKRTYRAMAPWTAREILMAPKGHSDGGLAWAKSVLEHEAARDAAYAAFDAEKQRVLEEAVGVDLARLWGPRWDEGLL